MHQVAVVWVMIGEGCGIGCCDGWFNATQIFVKMLRGIVRYAESHGVHS